MGKPIVLIVDDDPSFGMRLKKSFANAANWGCLFIDDLGEAYKIAESQLYDVKILLTDWHFEHGTDPGIGLLDGVDLVEKVQSNCPQIECFLMTAQQSAPNFHAKSSKINAVRIMFKMDFVLANSDIIRESLIDDEKASQQPWNVIEDNVIRLHPETRMPKKGEELTNPFNSYIQELPVGYRVVEPIPITVKADHDEGGTYFLASAPQLGLMVEGLGSNPMDAIDELKEIIITQSEALSDEEDLQGIAALSKELLENFITKSDSSGDQEFHYG